jgi:type II secretory pathway pseudopilin PulG
MMSCSTNHRLRGCRPAFGLSLVEVLMGLALGAMLFTSLTAAIQAGTRNQAANAEYARAMQTARVALANLTHAIRTAYDADIEGVTPIDGAPVTGTNLRLQPKRTPDPDEPLTTAYRWHQASGQLLYFPDSTVATDPTVTPKLARNLSRVWFSAEWTRDPNLSITEIGDPTTPNMLIRQVTVNMEVLVGGKSGERVVISASASPRRAMAVY